MFKKLFYIITIIALVFAMSGCAYSDYQDSHVVYDDYDDTFRYKPEFDYSYLNEL